MANCLALPSIEKQFEAIQGPKVVDTWSYTNKNFIMYVPDGVRLTKDEELEMASKRQEIVHNNTRLSSNPFDDKQSKDTISELAKSQAKVLTGKIGVDGNLLTPGSPQVRGFSFVKTPSPCPGVADSPLMTWGEIEGTPFRLDGSDTPIRPSTGPSFHIAQTSRRENIALELAEKAGERMRGQKAKAIEVARRNIASPYVRSSMERLATMSPAARRLATEKFGIKETLMTPSPRRTPKNMKITTPKKSTTTPSPVIRRKTPRLVNAQDKSGTNTATTEKVTLTDDLLNIPSVRRIKASDFF